MSIKECETMDRPTRIKRLRYQSWHRGCKETDWLLGNYCDKHLESLSDEDLAQFEAFLEEDDYDIWQWVAYGAKTAKPDYNRLIIQLQAMKQ
jgi:antitoxin CptB